ncbi:MAG: nucleotidyltransferase [Clostridiales bacterium]|nr:nucleotidyltransferase [Clostridiales bacterium]
MAELIVLAAGMGSRYGGLKQIEPVGKNDEIIADFSVYDAKRAGFSKAVFVIKRENEKIFNEKIFNRISKKFAVDYVFQDITDLPLGLTPPSQREKPWGTGQAVLCAKKAVSENFAVINSDDFYGFDTFKKLADFLRSETHDCGVSNCGTLQSTPVDNSALNFAPPAVSPVSHCMVGFLLKNTVTEFGSVSRGICDVSCGTLKAINETVGIKCDKNEIFTEDEGGVKTVLNPNAVVSMNAWGFHISAMDFFERGFASFIKENISLPKAEFYLPSAAEDMLKSGHTVNVFASAEKWYGVTYKQDRDFVVKALGEKTANGEYPQSLWA